MMFVRVDTFKRNRASLSSSCNFFVWALWRFSCLMCTPERRMGGVQVWLHLTRNVGTTWRWAFSITHRLICPTGKNLLYACSRGPCGPQNRSGQFRVDKGSVSAAGNRSPIPQSQPIAWLLYRQTTRVLMWAIEVLSVLVLLLCQIAMWRESCDCQHYAVRGHCSLWLADLLSSVMSTWQPRGSGELHWRHVMRVQMFCLVQ
jgi:hypothetical protein